MRDELELDSEKDTGSYDGEFTIIGADCVGYCATETETESPSSTNRDRDPHWQ